MHHTLAGMTVTTAAALTAALSARATAGGLPALATTAATGIALTATLAALTTTTLAAAGLALPAAALLPWLVLGSCSGQSRGATEAGHVDGHDAARWRHKVAEQRYRSEVCI